MLRQNRKGQWSVFGNDCEKGPDYALEVLSGIERKCPVDMGDVVVRDILNAGINFNATHSV